MFGAITYNFNPQLRNSMFLLTGIYKYINAYNVSYSAHTNLFACVNSGI